MESLQLLRGVQGSKHDDGALKSGHSLLEPDPAIDDLRHFLRRAVTTACLQGFEGWISPDLEEALSHSRVVEAMGLPQRVVRVIGIET